MFRTEGILRGPDWHLEKCTWDNFLKGPQMIKIHNGRKCRYVPSQGPGRGCTAVWTAECPTDGLFYLSGKQRWDMLPCACRSGRWPSPIGVPSIRRPPFSPLPGAWRTSRRRLCSWRRLWGLSLRGKSSSQSTAALRSTRLRTGT